MTDRYHSLTVVLEQDLREDDARALIDVISGLRGVWSVEGNVSDITTYMAVARVKRDLGRKLIDVIANYSEERQE